MASCKLHADMPSSCHRYNNLQTGFMSTSTQACLLAKEAGMQILPLLCPSQAQCNSVQKGLSGWPPPDLMAHTVKTVLGELAGCTQATHTRLQRPQHLHAGFAGSVADGTSYLTAANDDDDSIDLLFLHIAWDKAPHGSGCNPSGASQLDAGTLPLQHTQHASALPAGIAPTAGSDDWISAGSSAALHQWLDDVIKLLFQYPNFSSSVLTAVLLKNQEADDMLQVCLLAAQSLALHVHSVTRLLDFGSGSVLEHAQLQALNIKQLADPP